MTLMWMRLYALKVIRLKEVMERTGLGRTSIYNFMAAGSFPKSVSLGARAIAWLESEVDDWIVERIKERDRESKHS